MIWKKLRSFWKWDSSFVAIVKKSTFEQFISNKIDLKKDKKRVLFTIGQYFFC